MICTFQDAARCPQMPNRLCFCGRRVAPPEVPAVLSFTTAGAYNAGHLHRHASIIQCEIPEFSLTSPFRQPVPLNCQKVPPTM